MNKNHPRSASQGFLESLLAWNFVPRLPSQLTRLTPAWLGDPVSDNKTNNMMAVRGTYEHGIYLPDPLDVRDVKRLLRGYVPQELVDIIIEFAEYWPHSTSSVYFGDDNPFVLYGHPRETDTLEDMFLLRTPPVGLPRWGNGDQALFRAPIKPRPSGEAYLPEDFTNDKILGHPCRRIVFTIRSHDQGWGGNLEDQGSFRGSWTWFEAGLERWCKRNESELLSQQVLEAKEPSDQSGQPSMKLQDLSTVYPEVEYIERNQAYEFVFPIHPADNLQIQCNITAERQWQDHRVEWRHDDSIDDPARLEEAGRGTGTGNGQFVRELRVGDVVTVWAKVRFPGWVNNIASVKVDVFWAE